MTEFRYWWHWMLPTSCWCPTLMLRDRGTHFVSNIRHQHRCNRFLVEIFPAASSTHKIGIKVLQIQHRMFRICLKLTVTSHLQFCQREIWKVDFQSQNFRGCYRYRFHFEWFSKLILPSNEYSSKIELGRKFQEFNLKRLKFYLNWANKNS